MTVFWDVALMMAAVSISEISVSFNETTRRYIPEHSHLHTRCCENPKSHNRSQPKNSAQWQLCWIRNVPVGILPELSTAGPNVRVFPRSLQAIGLLRNIPLTPVFIKLWSAAISGKNILPNTERMKNTSLHYTSVLKLLIDLQHKVGELIISITSYLSVSIL
jgi:hypothetical protein